MATDASSGHGGLLQTPLQILCNPLCEAAVEAAGERLAQPYEGWIAADPFPRRHAGPEALTRHSSRTTAADRAGMFNGPAAGSVSGLSGVTPARRCAFGKATFAEIALSCSRFTTTTARFPLLATKTVWRWFPSIFTVAPRVSRKSASQRYSRYLRRSASTRFPYARVRGKSVTLPLKLKGS